MKTIKLRNASTKKTIYQFNVTDAHYKLAKKLGLNDEQWITELAKVNLKEHRKKSKDKDEV